MLNKKSQKLWVINFIRDENMLNKKSELINQQINVFK